MQLRLRRLGGFVLAAAGTERQEPLGVRRDLPGDRMAPLEQRFRLKRIVLGEECQQLQEFVPLSP